MQIGDKIEVQSRTIEHGSIFCSAIFLRSRPGNMAEVVLLPTQQEMMLPMDHLKEEIIH